MAVNDPRPRSAVLAAGLGLTLLAPAPAGAQTEGSLFDRPTELEMEFSAGLEYDSNVSVIDIDSNVGEGDTALTARAEVDYGIELADDTEFEAGYTLAYKGYNDFSDFDLLTQLGNLSIDRDFGDLKAGGTYRLINSRLGGDNFLTINQFAPFVSNFFSKTLYVRADYIYSDKSFDNRPGRDGDQHSVGADAYFFLDGVRRYLVVGYDYETMSADDDQFSYDGHGVKVRLLQRLTFGSRDTRLKLGARFETRDYDAPTPSIGEPRDDDRLRLEAEFEIPITDRYFVTAEYEYGDFSSALPAADYSQSVIGVQFGAQF
ncbi:MAG: surface lipoprotein assembly modifier [Pseudomonadota bacterium]